MKEKEGSAGSEQGVFHSAGNKLCAALVVCLLPGISVVVILDLCDVRCWGDPLLFEEA